VGKLAISIWFAQGLIIIITIIVSYLGHNRFTFRNSSNH
jgi:putative flippase GtrA